MSTSRLLEQLEEKYERDAERFAALDHDECLLCDAHGPDKRSLWMDCLYALDEAVPEMIMTRRVPGAIFDGYYLLICKSCRGRLIGKLREWADECRELRGLPKDHDGGLEQLDPDKNIPVRIDGRIVMMDHEEYMQFAKEKKS